MNTVNGIVTNEELAKTLGVSKRTVRSDITNINRILNHKEGKIVSLYGKGYMLEFPDRERLFEVISDVQNIQTREDRISYLMNRLIFEENKQDIEMLEEELYISHSTLEKDLKGIREKYEENFPFIELKREENMIYLENDEAKKREVLIQLYMSNWDYNSKEGICLKNVFDKNLVNQISLKIYEYTKRYHLYMEDSQNACVRIALMILYQRITDGKSLKEMTSYVKDKKYLELSEELSSELSTEWELEINIFEKHWLAYMFERNQSFHVKYYESPQEGFRNLPKGEMILTEKILGRVVQRYGIDFRQDEYFKKDFAWIIEKYSESMSFAWSMKTIYIEEMKREYPELERIAVYIGDEIEEVMDQKVNRKELESDLLPILVLSYKYLSKAKHGMIQAMLVSNLNYSLSHYLHERLQELYGNRMNILGPIPAYGIDEAGETECVISTVKSEKLSKKEEVVVISPLLKSTDKAKIESLIEKIERRYQKASGKNRF